MQYSVVALEDRQPVSAWDGMEIRESADVLTKAEAIQEAREMLHDKDLRDAGMVKVEVRDGFGECVWDGFVS